MADNVSLLSTIAKTAYNYPTSGLSSLLGGTTTKEKKKLISSDIDYSKLISPSISQDSDYFKNLISPSITSGNIDLSNLIAPPPTIKAQEIDIPNLIAPPPTIKAQEIDIPNLISPQTTKSLNLLTQEDLEREIEEYLEKRKETPWFYPTPWQNYPEPPKAGEPSPYNVDFYAALMDPVGYLSGKYAGGTTGQWTGEKIKISGAEALENLRAFMEAVKNFASPSGAIHSDDPNFQKWMDLLNQYGLSYTTSPLGDGKAIYKPTLPKEVIDLQNQIWERNIEKFKNSSLIKIKNALIIGGKDKPSRITIPKNTKNYDKYIKEARDLGFEVVESDIGAKVFLKPRIESINYEGYPEGIISPTAYSTYVPPFPDLGINPKTGLPYTQEEFAKLPDYQKVAIWMSQLLAPTGQISAAYQQTLAQALAGQRATIDQLASTISKYSGRFDEAWGIGEKATQMLEAAGAKVNSLLGEAENIIKQAGALYLNASQEAKPLYQQLYGAAMDIYNKAAQLSNYIAGTSFAMTEDLWRQYGDIYNQIQQAYQSVQTGQLAPQTQAWLDLLRDIQTQAVTETLNKYYEEKQRQLVDELAGRGIISSRTAATALAELGEAVGEQLRQAQYQILADYARQALELPFKQYEASLGLLQAPQTAASLMEAARRSMLSYSEPLTAAVSALAQGRGAATDYISALMNAARGYQATGAELASMAPSYFLPGQNLLTAARTLSTMAAEGLGAERAALESQYGMWAELPENLRKAFTTYGGLAQNLLSILADIYLGREKVGVAKKQSEAAQMASLITAIANIFG